MPMMSYKKNTVVLIQFPFSDFSDGKKRPALILCDQQDRDVTCVPISSKFSTGREDLKVSNANCEGFQFPIDSYVRVHKPMTIEDKLIVKKLGNFKTQFFETIKISCADYVRA